MSDTFPPQPFLQQVYDLRSGDGSVYSGDEQSRDPPLLPQKQGMPYVTLTFAQSMDAKIAGHGGKQLALSGKESMVMTHWLRTLHGGILVGIGTALNDNPQLNTRHLPPLPTGSVHKYHLPRPIILDTNLSLPADCKLLKNYQAGVGRRPWVVTTPLPSDGDDPRISRMTRLATAGARIIEVKMDDNGTTGRISIPDLLSTLRGLDIYSLMVEGGARVIQSFLATEASCHGCIDMVIITVAPTLVGDDGVGYGATLLSSDSLPNLRHVKTELFGRDAVIALKVEKGPHP
ncbi:bacterial bifunctional deaminase-reductase [Fomitopsis betulina]|nr:bacterial bifunctional deaminase-reductase [Fomitopsis betulina]